MKRVALACLLACAGAFADEEEEEPLAPRDRYPMTLAARPLSLPAGLLDIGFTYIGSFTPSTYGSGYDLLVRWSFTDRFELRDLGVYYRFLARRDVELGAGAGLIGIGYASALGLLVDLAATLDGKLHFGRAALYAKGVYTVELRTGDIARPSHDALANLELEIDLGARTTLLAGGEYQYDRAPIYLASSDDVRERYTPYGGIHVAAARWLEFRVTLGPSWTNLDGGPFLLGGRFTAGARVRW